MPQHTLKKVVLAFAFWGVFELGLLGLSFLPAGLPNYLIGLVFGALVTVFAYVLTLAFIRKDHLTLESLGLKLTAGSVPRFFIGLLAGMVVMGLMMLVILRAAGMSFDIDPDHSLFRAVFLSLVTFTLLSSMEEIAFRGYFLVKLKEAVGVRTAIYVTSLCFGIYHGLSIDHILGPASWGLTYGVLALWTRGLAIPIGFHAGLNFVPALFNDKPRYAEGLWQVSVSTDAALASAQTTAMALQIVVIVVGIVLVEVYIRRRPSS